MKSACLSLKKRITGKAKEELLKGNSYCIISVVCKFKVFVLVNM